jgi:uncharacterized protein (TIGR00369 family)
MSKPSMPNKPLPFDELAQAVQRRRSTYGQLSGLRLDRFAPAEAWSSLPYRPVFVGDSETGVLHGGVVTAMLDESCGMAVQLALDGTRAIATLDLRIDYQKPATPGLAISAHSLCYRVTRSIAFVRATAYQEAEDDPVATATACFMVGANRTNMLADSRLVDGALPSLDAPDDPTGPFASSPFARFLGVRHGEDGRLVMHPWRHDRRLSRNGRDRRRDPRARRLCAAQADRSHHQLFALGARARQLRARVDRQAGPARGRLRGAGLAGRSGKAHRLGVRPFHAAA